MTREEAITIIQNEYKCVDRECDIERSCGKCPYMIPSKEPILQAYEMAIQALSQEPICDRDCEHCTWTECPIEPCDDAISRDAVIKAVDAHTNEDGTLDDDISVILEDIPSATQNPKYWIDKDNKLYKIPDDIPQKSGHWVADVDRWGDVITTVNGYRCDKCNAFNSDKDNYCPNCGARMAESGDKE